MLAPRAPLSPPPPIGPEWSLFLDFDGTLVDLAQRPDAVIVDASVTALLARTADRLGGRLALVSGRSIAQLERFLGADLARYGVAGSHGAEIRGIGTAAVIPARPGSLDAAERAFAAHFEHNPAVVIERKSLGVGLHFRQHPASEEEAHALVERWAAEHGLDVQRGKMMVELRLPGYDKGTALRALAADPPFAGHTPVFVGDDVTDEAGFREVDRLGGFGVLVGEERKTAARYRLDNVASVLAWLDAPAR
jgi:trehalose 6-phosphate phosphatase